MARTIRVDIENNLKMFREFFSPIIKSLNVPEDAGLKAKELSLEIVENSPFGRRGRTSFSLAMLASEHRPGSSWRP